MDTVVAKDEDVAPGNPEDLRCSGGNSGISALFQVGKGLEAYMAPAGTLSTVPVVQSISRQTSEQMQEAPRKGSDTRERVLDVAEAAVL